MPKKVDHQERRELIAAALMRLVAEQGLEAVSLRQVAAEAGVSGGMVQHYFPTKDAMMAFAMESASSRYEARMTQALQDLGEDPAPLQTLEAVLTTLVPRNPAEERDARVALAFMAYSSTRGRASAGVEAENAGMRSFLAELIVASGRQSDAGAGADAEDAAVALLALVDGLALQVLSARLPAEDAVRVLRGQLAALLGSN